MNWHKDQFTKLGIKMIDYIKITKSLHDKDNAFLDYCKHEADYSSGWSKYIVNGCNELFIWYNSNSNLLRLEGSIMYFWQGHNFTYSTKNFYKAIEHINTITQTDFWDSKVEIFEFGIIMRVDDKPKEYIKNHEVAPKEKLTMEEKSKDKGHFRWYEGSNVILKMYDAGRNIKYKQGMTKRKVIEEAGWNPKDNFLKFEVKYKKPEILNEGNPLLLSDLVSPEFIDLLKGDLHLQYQRLSPVKSINRTLEKSNLSTSDILIFHIAKKYGSSILKTQKSLYEEVNSIPKNILNKSDKDSRKRQIKNLCMKLTEDNTSKWDLSERIANNLLL